jgi:hypothetical protein
MRDSETEQAMLSAGQPAPVMFVDGLRFEGMQLCLGCEEAFVLEGYCKPCAELCEYMESKRLREANVERQFQEAVQRHQMGIELYEESDDPDPPVTALMVILAAFGVVSLGIFGTGVWFLGKAITAVLLRWSA